MSKIKAIVDFTGYTGPELAPVAQAIHDHMSAKAVLFPAPPLTLLAFQALITTFEQKLAAKASRATADVIACALARHNLEGALADLGGYVNSVAKGRAIPPSSPPAGFPLMTPRTPRRTPRRPPRRATSPCVPAT